MKFGFQLCSEFDPSRLPKNGVCEIKEDGILAMWEGPTETLWTRKGNDVTPRYPDLVPNLPRNAVLLMEVCVFSWGPPRVSRFEGGIMNRMGLMRSKEIGLKARQYPVTAYAFDVLEVDGASLAAKPLRERRKALERLVPRPVTDGEGRTRLIIPEQHLLSDLAKLLQMTSDTGMEGVVVKDLDAPYVPTPEKGGKRASSWQKAKNWHEKAFPVLRHETTENEGFVIYVPLERPSGQHGEQRVAVNDPQLQAQIRAGARLARVAYLNHTADHSLRQPWCKGLDP